MSILTPGDINEITAIESNKINNSIIDKLLYKCHYGYSSQTFKDISSFKIKLSKELQSKIDYFFSKEIKKVKYQTSKKYQDEFEIRFQNLNFGQFNKIKNTIENDEFYLNKHTIVTSTDILPNDTGVGDNIRHEKDEYGNSISYQIKENIFNFVLPIDKNKIKFSLSKEININPDLIDDKYILINRKKNRTRYNFNLFFLDLTIVDSFDYNSNKNFKSYEVEIEINILYEHLLTQKYILLYITYILDILYPEKLSYIDSEYEKLLRLDYKKLFPKFSNKPLNFIFENKPKNFKLDNINNFNHSITNKLNGVNFFLLFSYERNILYFINHSAVDVIIQHVNYKNLNNNINGDILIQGELFEYKNKKTFYIFDVLIINNKNITELNHPDRCKSFQPFLDTFNILLEQHNKPLLEFKKFYGFLNTESNFYENLINCKNSLKTEPNSTNIDMEINDGFIFTPLEKGYINNETYKYKFPETMTIDFLVKISHQENKTKYFKLFVYNESETFIPFSYNNKHYYMKCDLDKHRELFYEIQNNSIVECSFDKQQNVFYPYRIRFDKIKPNFYKVANDVFYDIVNPITLDILEKSFKNKFYVNFITIDNIDFKVPLSSVFECVLYCVSPEYRNANHDKKLSIYNSGIRYFKDINKLEDFDFLSNNFNIKLCLLEEHSNNKFKIIKESSNNIKNIMYFLKVKDNSSQNINDNKYIIFGYKVGKYEIFCF